MILVLIKQGTRPPLPNKLIFSLSRMLQVYGTIFHMNQGNPFKLKALVDKWPDFNTVVVRPQEQVRYRSRYRMHTLLFVVCAYPAPGSADAGQTEMNLSGEQVLVLKESSQPGGIDRLSK